MATVAESEPDAFEVIVEAERVRDEFAAFPTSCGVSHVPVSWSLLSYDCAQHVKLRCSPAGRYRGKCTGQRCEHDDEKK